MSDVTRREFGLATLSTLLVKREPFPGSPKRDEREGGRRAEQPSSRAYRYIHLDVFTDKRLQGNQLLVYVDPAGLDTEMMQTLTRESNFSENTFVFPPEAAGTDYRVRIFSRTAEMPFAGHPTIGTAFALAHVGKLKPGQAKTNFGLGVGPTDIDLEWKDGKLAFAWMTQQKPTFGKTIGDSAALAAAIGLDAASIDTRAPAQEVYSGSTFVIVPLTTRKAVDAAVLDRAKVDAVFNAAGVQRRGLYVFSTERGQDDATAYSRMLPAGGGIEDPATGSAVGPAGSFMAKHRFVPQDRAGSIVVLQGVVARRPSRLHVRVEFAGGDVAGVKVGGTSAVVGEGTATP
jgi:trans-2,3-dihydro-3-hydroxyanthranilate isomerase